jgi:hypothetical protein
MEYKTVGQLKVPQGLSPEKQKLVDEIAQNYLNELSDINAAHDKGKTRGAVGSLISGASFHPFFNVPYVGTGIGGAMYDAGQGIVEGAKLPEIAKRAARGFAIGETIGAVPYVGKLASKTKAGQAVGKALDEAAEKFAQTKAYDALMSEFAPAKEVYKKVILEPQRKMQQQKLLGEKVNPLAKAYNEVLFDTPSFNQEIEDIAKKYFGTTTNRREAGYILNDGSYLDMSGKKFGGSAGKRSLDHREIVDAFIDNPENVNNLEIGFDEFIDNGAVRYMPETNSFFMSRQPSEAQIKAIKNLLDYERGKSSFELVPNVKDWGSSNNFRQDYKLWSDPNKIIDDIRIYFKGGKPSEFKDYL